MASEVKSSQLPLSGLEGQKIGSLKSPCIEIFHRKPPKERATEWCFEERKRIVSGVYSSEDLRTVHHELHAVFVTSLQEDSLPSWEFFVQLFLQLEGIQSHLTDFREGSHYTERVVEHVSMHSDRLLGLEIVDAMIRVFPEITYQIRQGQRAPKQAYYYPEPPPRARSPTQIRAKPKRASFTASLLLPDGSDPFTLRKENENFDVVPKPLTWGDLRCSIGTVGIEAAQRESVWGTSVGFMKLALASELPEDPRQYPKDEVKDKAKVLRIISEEVRESMAKSDDSKKPLPSAPMSGREAVQYFARMHHLGKVRHMYFNIVPNKLYNPYDIIAVSKYKSASNHFVFSSFGVLCVRNDGPSEVLSLGEWCREAVLFKAIRQIPFFKNYITMRCFRRWLQNKRYAHFLRTRQSVKSSLLLSIPLYGASVIRISTLLQELSMLKFLPMRKDICYTLSEFETEMSKRGEQMETFLKRFYALTRSTIEEMSREQYDKLDHCERQVRNVAVINKESLYMANQKRLTRENNFKQAKAETQRLGNLVMLLDQLILSRLVAICRDNVCFFVDEVMQNVPEEQREALFKADLFFNEEGKLSLSPDKSTFQALLNHSLKDMPHQLCDASLGIDSDTLVKTRLLNNADRPETRYAVISVTKSSQPLRMGPGGRPQRAMFSNHVTHLGAGSTAAGLREESELEARLRLHTPKVNLEDLTPNDMGLSARSPDLAVGSAEPLGVIGKGFVGQYAPLAKGNIEDKLMANESYIQSLASFQSLLEASFEEIDKFVVESEWLNEINAFCQSWGPEIKGHLKDAPVFEMDQLLTKIRNWTEQVRNFEKGMLTTNRVCLVDCGLIHQTTIPQLNGMLRDVIDFISAQAWNLAEALIADMADVILKLRNRSDEVSAFASFAKMLSKYKDETPAYQKKVEYIKALFELVRLSFRPLTQEEEQTEVKMTQQWKRFLAQMQEAGEFLNIKSPLVIAKLEQLYKELVDEVEELGNRATSGRFLDPAENPSKILIAMRHIRNKFYDLEERLKEASKWREETGGEMYDLSFLGKVGSKIYIRQELWKYVEVCTHTILDWKRLRFRKMSVHKAEEKIIEWQAVVKQMEEYLPPGDKLLSHWLSMLTNFRRNLPIFRKLSNEALKVKHWKAIFVGIGEVYDPEVELTVEQLIALNLGKHETLIRNVYAHALSEFRLEQRLSAVQKSWYEKDLYFKLAKYIPESIYLAANTKRDQAQLQTKKTQLEAFIGGRSLLGGAMPTGLDLSKDDLYVLKDIEELKYILEDSQITLQQILLSSYVGEFRSVTERLYANLKEVEEIVNLWTICQTQWLYLLTRFETPAIYCRNPSLTYKFESVHKSMKDVQKSVLNNPRVITIVTHGRGDRGYRPLQGDSLMRQFRSMITSMEEILLSFSGEILSMRKVFPRLFYLSDNEVVQLMASTRDPQLYLPFITKCFPGIQLVRYSLPEDFQVEGDKITTLEYSLNVGKLEVNVMIGELGESIPLVERVRPSNEGAHWLLNFEASMRDTMMNCHNVCVHERLIQGDPDPSCILAELPAYLANMSEKREKVSGLPVHSDIEHYPFTHWLLKHPSQCILTAESVLWSTDVQQALEAKDEDAKRLLRGIRDRLLQKISKYVSACASVQSDRESQQTSMVHLRVVSLLTSFISQLIYLKDLTGRLVTLSDPCLNCFEWARLLRYEQTVQTTLTAKVTVIQEEVDAERMQRLRGGDVTSGRKRSAATGMTSVSAPGLQTDSARLTPAAGLSPAAGLPYTTARSPAASMSHPSTPKSYVSGLRKHGRQSTTAEEPHIPKKTKTDVEKAVNFGALSLCQFSYSHPYGYEYLGPGNRLVMTPLTERSYLTLFSALRNVSIGALIGPSSTGKTETIHGLAKLCGTMLHTVTCGKELNQPIINQLLCGGIQSGGWLLFDDTNHLSAGLMSIVTHQLRAILPALRVMSRGAQMMDAKRTGRASARSTKTSKGVAQRRSRSAEPVHTTLHIAASVIQSSPTVLDKQPDESQSSTEAASTACKGLRTRRHSVSGETALRARHFYKAREPLPLFDRLSSYEISLNALRKGKKVDPAAIVSNSASAKVKMWTEREASYATDSMGSVMFNGNLLAASRNAAFFMTLGVGPGIGVPIHLKNLMRVTALVIPDQAQICECLLHSHGVPDASSLSTKFSLFMKFYRVQFPSEPLHEITLNSVRLIMEATVDTFYLLQAVQAITQDGNGGKAPENVGLYVASADENLGETALVAGIYTVLGPRMQGEQDEAILRDEIGHIFPVASLARSSSQDASGRDDPQLIAAVQKQMQTIGLQDTAHNVAKIMQLHVSLQQSQAVVLVGPAGSGKTTVHDVLCQTFNHLHSTQFEADEEEERQKLITGLTHMESVKMFATELSARAAQKPKFLRMADKDHEKEDAVAAPLKTLASKWRKVSHLLGKFGMLRNLEDRRSKGSAYPRINKKIIHPNSMNCEEMFGVWKGGMWCDGLLSSVMDEALRVSEASRAFCYTYQQDRQRAARPQRGVGQQEGPSTIGTWVVLDGEACGEWVERIGPLVDGSKSLGLASGRKVHMNTACSLIFEMGSLKHASPACVSKCSVIHCGSEPSSWKLLVESWIAQAKVKWLFTDIRPQLKARLLKMINQLVSDIFSKTLKFLSTESTMSLDADIPRECGSYRNSMPGIHQVSSFLAIMSTLLDTFLLREPGDTAELTAEGPLRRSLGRHPLANHVPTRGTPRPPLTPQQTAEVPQASFVPRAPGSISPSHSQSAATGVHGASGSTAHPSAPGQPEMVHSLGGERTVSASSSGKMGSEQTGAPRNAVEIIKSTFVYAYTWAFGGGLSERSKGRFDLFAREALHTSSHRLTAPRSCTLFELYVNSKDGTLVKVVDQPIERPRNIPASYSITPHIEKYHHLTETLLLSGHPVLLTGPPGVGKTALVQNMITHRIPLTRINMSPGMTSSLFQEMILVRVQERKSKEMYRIGPKTVDRLTVFIDDLNSAPIMGETEIQPSAEVLREMISHGITYDRSRRVVEETGSTRFFAACTSPGCAGSGFGVNTHSLSDRLVRHFTVIDFSAPTDQGVFSLYGRILESWLEEFPSYAVEHHYEFAKAMMHGLIDIYEKVREKFKATPAHAHYVFTYHDIARVIEGMLMLSPRKGKVKPKRTSRRQSDAKKSKPGAAAGTRTGGSKSSRAVFKSLSVKDNKDAQQKLINPQAALPMMPVIARLWCHEVTRTFADRLLTDEAEAWFRHTLHDVVEKHLCTASEDWIETHSTTQAMKAIYEESHTTLVSPQTVGRRGEGHRGTPIPFTKPAPSVEEGEEEGGDGESYDGSMTEVTAEVVTPFSDHEEDEEMERMPPATPSDEDEEGALERITPFTESTVMLPEVPMSPELDEEKPTLDQYKARRQRRRRASLADEDESGASSGEGEEGSSEEEGANRIGTTSGKAGKAGVQKANVLPASQGSRKPKQRRQDKRGVTFKMGLIADKEVEEEYKGALMTFDEVRGSSEDLMDITFSRYYMSAYADSVGVGSERGYAEYSEQQHGEALDTCMEMYNRVNRSRVSVVFFREAIRHAARLTRVLSLPGAHTLLLGLSRSSGRSTLTRLSTHIAHCKLFEVKNPEHTELIHDEFRSAAKLCSYSAGIMGRQSALYVQGNLGEEVMRDICSLMVEGTCPGLYSAGEMQQIATAMTAGQVQTRRIEKIDFSFERFLKKVKRNMHIILCLDYEGQKTKEWFDTVRKYPQIVTKMAGIDCYKPWTFDNYTHIAKKWLLAEPATSTTSTFKKFEIPFDRDLHWEQLVTLCKAFAYIHKSSEVAIERLHCHRKQTLTFFTPLTFQSAILLFKDMLKKVINTQNDKVTTLNKLLSKVDEAYVSIDNLQETKAVTQPDLDAANKVIEELVGKVTTWRGTYIQALDDCKSVERTMEKLREPLEDMKKRADSEFDAVNPTYYAAVEAVKLLGRDEISEIKTFRVPPKSIEIVGEALCVMFQAEPACWETAKHMMLKPDFFQDLEYYDKMHVPTSIFQRLETFVNDPNFEIKHVIRASKSAGAVCSWIHAVYRYASIYAKVAPKLAALLEAEDKLNKAQAELGHKRISAMKVKEQLEHSIREHSEATQKARVIEIKIREMEKRIKAAREVMSNMVVQNALWRSEKTECEERKETALGDALLVSAQCLYLGPFDSHTRQALLNEWRDRLLANAFDYSARFARSKEQLTICGETADLPSMHYRLQQSAPTPDGLENEQSNDKGTTSSGKNPQRRESRVIVDCKSKGCPVIASLDYSLEALLSSFEEMSDWKRRGYGQDTHSMHSALSMRATSDMVGLAWPLLIDPDGQAEGLVRLFHSVTTIEQELSGSEPDDAENRPMREHVTDHARKSSNISSSADLSSQTAGLNSEDMNTSLRMPAVHTLLVPANGQLTMRSRDSLESLSEADQLPGIVAPGNSRRGTLSSSVLLPDDLVPRPDDNLWVLPADHPELDHKMINAITHGIVLLITHMQRKRSHPLFESVVWKRFTKNPTGQTFVRIKDFDYLVHPRFRLYLSSSMPLYLKGDDTADLLISGANVIDLTLSQQARMNSLLVDIMRSEQPDFEVQARSITAGILSHKMELSTDMNAIVEKVLQLDHALLEDATLLDTLLTCQQKLQRNCQILEETLYLQDRLSDKRLAYRPVANHAAMVFDVIEQLSLLSPYYFFPFASFRYLCSETLGTRHRGKGSMGSPLARCQELINAITAAAYSRVSTMTFERHTEAFTMLLSLQRMIGCGQAARDEVSVFLNGMDRSRVNSDKYLEKPDWISHEMWLSCCKLEESLPCFRGSKRGSTSSALHDGSNDGTLTRSLVDHREAWEEYLSCPISLVTQLPGDLILNDFQKCVLWRVCVPSRMNEVIRCLILRELGPAMLAKRSCTVRDLYIMTSQKEPIVLLAPTEPESGSEQKSDGFTGFVLRDSVTEIRRLASSPDGMDRRVVVVSMGDGVGMGSVELALKHCMCSGHWLVLCNAHLAQRWSVDVLDILKRICMGNEPGSEKAEESTRKRSIHPDFRLWVLTQAASGRVLPGTLLWHSLRATNEQIRDFKDVATHTNDLCSKRLEAMDTSTRLALNKKEKCGDNSVQLCSLHSTLLQRRYYRTAGFSSSSYHWGEGDLDQVWSLMGDLLMGCREPEAFTEIVDSVYSGVCVEAQDQLSTSALVKRLVLSKREIIEESDCSTSGAQSLLRHLLTTTDRPPVSRTVLEDALRSAEPFFASTFSLPQAADVFIKAVFSRQNMAALVDMSSSHELAADSVHLTSFERVENMIGGIASNLPEPPAIPSSSLHRGASSTLESFFSSEVAACRLLLSMVAEDMECLRSATRGDTACSPLTERDITDLHEGHVPKAWSVAPWRFPATRDLMVWMACLTKSSNLLALYADGSRPSGPYNLAAFHRPDYFLQSVLVHHARTEFLDVGSLCFEVKLLPSQSVTPDSGCLLTGLHLRNASWSVRTGSITMSPDSSISPTTTTTGSMPLLWLKPTIRSSVSSASASNKRSGSPDGKQNRFSCPVVLNQASVVLSQKDILTFFELPSEIDAATCQENQVFLLGKLE